MKIGSVVRVTDMRDDFGRPLLGVVTEIINLSTIRVRYCFCDEITIHNTIRDEDGVTGVPCKMTILEVVKE